MKNSSMFVMLLFVGLAVSIPSQQANAAIAILNTALKGTPLGGYLQTLNDRDVERVLDSNGNAYANQLTQTFVVGDILESVVVVDNVSNAVFGAVSLDDAVNLPGDYQLTIHAQQTISSITGTGPFTIGFGPAVFNVYEDSSTINTTPTFITNFAAQGAGTAVTMATDGNLILSLNNLGTGSGATPDAVTAIGAITFGALTSGNEANTVGALSIIAPPGPGMLPIALDATLSGAFGPVPGTGALHDVVFTGEIELAATSVQAQGWAAQTDTTINFTITPPSTDIPEPMSVVVWSILATLAGLVYVCRRTR